MLCAFQYDIIHEHALRVKTEKAEMDELSEKQFYFNGAVFVGYRNVKQQLILTLQNTTELSLIF